MEEGGRGREGGEEEEENGNGGRSDLSCPVGRGPIVSEAEVGKKGLREGLERRA